MRLNNIPSELKELAGIFAPAPLYAVGGFVLSQLTGGFASDIDITSPLAPEKAREIIVKSGKFKVLEQNLRVGTLIVTSEGGFKAEYTAFRVDSYPEGSGEHKPSSVIFTDDIALDATRRDFKMNAVYLNLLTEEIVDPLGGLIDIENKVVSATREPSSVFSEDGERLMRLARFAAAYGFEIEQNTLKAAKENSGKILDIAKERVAKELKKILSADEKGVIDAHYRGILLLDEIGVLTRIFPELEKAKNFKQDERYHKYNVFDHITQAVRFAKTPIVRLAALFHDIAKPMAVKKDGNMYRHAEYGREIAKKYLGKDGLKLSHKEVDTVCRLVENHMYDLIGNTKKNKIRFFIIKNLDILDLLLELMDSDGKASKSGYSEAARHIRGVYEKMLSDGTPLTLSDLKVNGHDLAEMGYKGSELGKALKELFNEAVVNENLRNRKSQLEYLKRRKK